MTPERQRIAIAEWEGWRVEHKEQGGIKYTVLIAPDGRWMDSTSGHATLANFGSVPDYLHDLNAVHEAEKRLDGRWMSYEACLRHVCRGNPICHATAAQRAEALLRTLGLWEEE